MICTIKNASTVMYHLFQYFFSDLRLFFSNFIKNYLSLIFFEVPPLGAEGLYLIYFPLLFAIKFANNLYAPGTPAGNSLKNTRPV